MLMVDKVFGAVLDYVGSAVDSSFESFLQKVFNSFRYFLLLLGSINLESF